MRRMINVHDAKTHLSRLLEEVARGEEIVLARSGKPIARLLPLHPEAVPMGFVTGVLDDSFFDPLPEGWDGQ